MYQDSFADLARYYDVLMSHVDYDRWYATTAALGELLPEPVTHVDMACGTCKLIGKLRETARWRSFGIDLSMAMLCQGRRTCGIGLGAVADLRAVPFSGSADLVTCLFDSLNFLLAPEDLEAAMDAFSGALKPSGIAYFDVITERMVLDHFAGRKWSEDHGRFTAEWFTKYHRETGIADTEVTVNHGPPALIRERVFSSDEVRTAIRKAGLTLLGEFDAETWYQPGRKTLRVDMVAAKDPHPRLAHQVHGLREVVRGFLR